MNFPDEFSPDFESDIDTELIFLSELGVPGNFKILIKYCDDEDLFVRYRCLVLKDNVSAAVFSISESPEEIYEVSPLLTTEDRAIVSKFISDYQDIFKRYTDQEYFPSSAFYRAIDERALNIS